MARTLRSYLGMLSLVALLLFPGYGSAAIQKAHTISCNVCHKVPTGQNPRKIGNLCLNCHATGKDILAEESGTFSTAAASDRMNSHPSPGTGPGSQTSHFWGGSLTAMPAAGSQDPPASYYYSRNYISTGLMTCSICHDPHGDMNGSTKLLLKTTPTSDVNDVVCKQCHVNYYQDLPSAQNTHPVGVLVVPTADPLKFNPAPVNIGSGGAVQLVNGTYVSCTSCHSAHFADSDSTTVDGNLLWNVDHWEINNTLVAGDGRLLRTDGPTVTGADAQDTANRRSAICTACHPYKTHGNAGEPLGCLVCHSAHNSVGSTNYFVLRNSATTSFGAVTGLTYTTVPPLDLTGSTSWADVGVTTNGYCEKCHGNLMNTLAGGISASRQHIEGENCRTCHLHNKAGATRSFEAVGGCDGCHGYPPTQNVAGGNPNAGYAAGYTPFKDESATPHAAHAAGSGNYSFSCSSCHLNNAHNSASSFQDVFLGVDAPLATGNGNMSPTYTATGSGTCANVYCHSNGGARSSDVARTFTAATIPVWTAGSTTGAITTCNACHDNSNSMTNGSAAHAAHLALSGVTCKTCHVTTADSATALAAGAIGGSHVNGTRNVAFDTSGFITVGATPYDAATGTCSVYCHSNGTTFVAPDWDVSTSGDCGTCHSTSAASLSGAHVKHLAITGVTCADCHGANAALGTHTGHVDGSFTFSQTACDNCHGYESGEKTPVWNDSMDNDYCLTCHTGASAGIVKTMTAPNKELSKTKGHNATANYTSGNVPANKLCTSCHLTTITNHVNVTDGDATSLVAAATDCTTSCHGVSGSAVKDGIVTHRAGQNCSLCHDPHGSSNIYMISYGSVVFTATSGADSYDEDDNSDRVPGTTAGVETNADDICATCHTGGHNNSSNSSNDHNQGTDCFTSCHKSHTDAAPFSAAAGTACNQCHGFPPATAAHDKHSASSSIYDTEDRSDCAACHTGAASYTYSTSTDQGNSLNHGNATGRRTLLASSVGFSKGAGNVWTCTNACHVSTTSDGFWYTWDNIGQPSLVVASRLPIDSNGLDCTSCHYYSATPTSAGNVVNGKSEALGGDHSAHFGLGGVVTCANCHVVPTDSTHISIPSGTDAEKYQDRALAEQDEADVTAAALGSGSDPDAGNATCNNTACHNPSGTTYSATWISSTVSCALCHSETDPGTGSHDEHMGAATTFGINTVACTSCHVNNGTNNAHRNGTVTFAAGMNYTGGAEDVGGTLGTCTTTTCHNDGTAAANAVQSPTWNTLSVDCSICHGYAPGTYEHAQHFASTTYVPGGCDDCHASATAATHINNTRNLGGKISDMDVVTGGNQLVAPGGWDGTCTNNCHIVADNAHGWISDACLNCEDCHGSGKVTTPALDRGWPPNSGAHLAHVANTNYVTGNCRDCHNDNGFTVHSTLNNVVTAIGGTKVSGYTVNNCTNTCHVAADTNDWTAGTRACVDCHMVGKTGLYDSGVRDQAPTSGLHATTNALAHDDLFGASNYTCTNCHNSATPSAAHMTGTLQTTLQTTYTYTAQIAGYSNANGCASSCHKDGGDWNRKWIGVVDATPAYTDLATAAVCKNCHGSFAQGWNYVNELGATTSDHTDPDADNTGDQMNAGGHAVCSKCHGWGDASYQSGLMHNNNLIAMNSDLGYDNGTGNCTTNCHSGKTLTTNTNSGFTNESGTFGGVGCGSCHDDGTIPPNSGAHAAHGANADADYSECILCHGNNGDNYATTSGTHSDTFVTFAAGITYSNGGTPGTNAAADNDTCSTTICHTGSGTVVWSATSLGCSECHYHNASPTTAGNTGINALGGSHNKHFGTGGVTTCDNCHPVLGAGDTTHINGATNLTDKANATMDEAEVTAAALNTGSDPDAGNATCNNVACHNPSNGAFTATWTVANAAGCAFCHSATDPGTDSHDEHMGAATTFGINTVACTSCHVNNGTNNAHRNGSVSFVAGMNYSGGAQAPLGTNGTCNTSTCHNDGTVAATPVPTTNWGTPSVDCTICHGNAPATGAHASHANATYVAGSCSDCHTAANVSTHINGTRNVANKVSVYNGTPNFTCTNSCHIADTTNDWTPSGALACTDCHGSLKVTTPALDRSWPPASGAHGSHVGNFYVAANCVNCHNDNTTTHSTLNNVVTTALGTSITVNSGNGSCTNSCHLAGQASDWTGGSAAITCTDCHTSGKIGGGVNDKTSGLHIGPLTVSATTHDDTIAGGCAACHVTVMAQGTHIDGAFTGGNGQTTQMGLTTGIYVQTANDTGTCANACHSDGGAWNRKWSITARTDATPNNECANCHGDFDSGFVTGVGARHQTTTSGDADGDIANNHDGTDKCYTCHNYKAGDTTYYNIANSPVGQHRDGSIQINSNAGVVDNGTSVGCNKCHTATDGTADEGHEFFDVTSRWLRALVAGPAVSCSSCHGYPPNPGDGKTPQATESKGAHLKHVNHIATRAGVTLDANADTFDGATSAAVCGVCHDVSTTANHSTTGGTRNLLLQSSHQFGGSVPSYKGTVGVSSSVGGSEKTCSNLDCHFKETPIWAPVSGE